MKQKISFRKANVSDIPFMTLMLLESAEASCCHIDVDKLSDFPETEVYIKDFPRPLEVGVIAETATGELVGCAWISIFPEPLHVVKYPLPELTIAVLSKFRRLGVASQLLTKLYEAVIKVGIKEISLGVHYQNIAAIRLYEKHKWVVDGEINNGEYIMMSRYLQ